jgi:tRNA pseudouridine55 synthase
VADPRRGARAKRDAVHGVLLVDKPLGLGSTTVVGRIKHLLNAEKAGHTGTLDPLATGLLPICLGEATKFAADLLHARKSYRATLLLGVTTTTADAEGEVKETRPVTCDAAAVAHVLDRFKGVISQMPPMFSALKRDGKPLYSYARAGVTLERETRDITIQELESVSFDGVHLVIDVTCSKGTYVRTLGEDIGEALGCGAHLSGLRRTRVAGLQVGDAVSLDALGAMSPAERRALLLPLDALITELPALALDESLAARFRAGQRISGFEGQTGRMRVYAVRCEPDALLGVAVVDDGVLRPRRLVAVPQSDAVEADFSERT